ncbi:NYN domain-containing protein [Methylibium petroleiphilum]|uniref:NYN domain-containing protein n=1 Tax=Methylibium petroleiphilum TaxID=105560 RepID=UPI001ACC06FA|nr:NYN domain-containing protein [Methylibium petroleiphilum]MBN9204403.1 NYN domain-containing protein [Methylibium petroleiphilum]
MSPTTIRTALLVDADNVKVELVAEVIDRLRAAGRVLQHRRAYGSVQKASEFATLSQDHAIRFLPSTFAGPNATDLALAIDAVELVLRQPVDEVVLVSSDRDFAPLIVRLRELGCRVVGFGQHGKTAQDVERDYLRVYDEFHVLGAAGPAPRSAASKPAAKPRVAKAAKTARSVKPAVPAPAAPVFPAEVEAVLAACPDLRQGRAMRLNAAGKALHDSGVLKKNGRPSALFKRLEPHFEMLPADKPEQVRLRS